MDPWSAAAFAAPIIGGLFGKAGQASANRANIALAREQMAFQERMSNTEVQRRVADLRAAGLNPMLAYSGAASAPSGALARVENTNEPLARGISSAFGSAVQAQQLENMSVQNRLIAEQAEALKIDNTIQREKVPYAAQAAAIGQGTLEVSLEKLAADMRKAKQDLDIGYEQLRTAKLSNEQLEKLQPILLELQKLEQRAKAMDMTRLENLQNFEEKAGDMAPFVRFLLEVIRGGRR